MTQTSEHTANGKHREKNGTETRGNSRLQGTNQTSGTLVIIGGHEDKTGEKIILSEIARRVGGGKIVVTTVASHQPEGYFEPYQTAFRELGASEVVELTIRNRHEAFEEDRVALLEGAACLFFTGGDQLKITSQIGDTPIMERIQAIYNGGGVIAGTSAGASAMCETMLVRGTGDESYRIGDLMMAPGLGLIGSAIIDQHFAERGRIGRLLGAVAQNPRILGIGIDENTAIVVDDAQQGFTVLGNGGVYVADGGRVTYSNIADEARDSALSLYNLTLHILSHNDRFDLTQRRPASLAIQRTGQTIAVAAQTEQDNISCRTNIPG